MTQEHAVSQREERASNDNRTRETVTSTPQAQPQAPSKQERWAEARPTKMIVFWICLGAIALAITLGFSKGGWTTGGSAERLAKTAAQVAVVQRLGTICVAQFNLSPDHAKNLAEMQALSSSKRSTFIREQGWATMPGETPGQDTSESKVAGECAKQLFQTASN